MLVTGEIGVCTPVSTVTRRSTVDVWPYRKSGHISTDSTVVGLSGKSNRRMPSHRRHHSEPIHLCSLTRLLSDSEETLKLDGGLRGYAGNGGGGAESNLNDDSTPVGESWDETKRFLIESRIRDREISRDMERENMHLYLSEMLIAAMEQMHWRMVIDDSQQNSLTQPKNTSSCPTLATSSEMVDSSGAVPELKPTAGELRAGSSIFYASADDLHVVTDEETPTDKNTYSNGNDDNDNDDSECENSAEAIAASLLRHFSNAYKPRSAAEIQWLVSYAQAPQKLLPMPDDIAVFFEELRQDGHPIFFRGSQSWAPPRKQWIFKIQPPLRSVRKLLEQQEYRCGGCGIKVGKVYTRRMRYCNYYGRLFCQRCHRGARSRIPARIIYQWNFKEYPISDIAHRFLRDNHQQPVINASAVDPRFYDKIRRLRKIRQLRIKLVHIWSYIRLCSIAEETVTKHGNLCAIFSTVPKHMLSDADVYSMEDLENVQKGELFRLLTPIVQYGQYHVEGCEHCRAQAFVCELCDARDDLLFPFQTERVYRCDDCGSLSHRKCAVKRCNDGRPCPKCVRIQQNRERHRHHSENSLAPAELQNVTVPLLAA